MLPLYVEKKHLKIKKGRIKLSEGDVDINGIYISREIPYLDLNFKLDKIKPAKLIKLALKEKTDSIEFKAQPSAIRISGYIKGEAGKGKIPEINIDLELEGGSFKFRNNGIGFEEISLAGNYNNGKQRKAASTTILIDSCSALFKGNEIKGKLELKNLDKPWFKSNLNGDLDLHELKMLIPGLKDYHFSGLAHVNLSISGELSDLKSIKIDKLETFQPVGHIELIKASGALNTGQVAFSELNGSIMLGKHFWIDELNGKINGNQFTLSGEARNVLSYLGNRSQTIAVMGELYSRNFDIGRVITATKKNTESADSSRESIWFPDWLTANIEVSAGSLSLGKFSSDDFRGSLIYEPSRLYLNSISLKTMSGEVKGNCQIFDHTGESVLIQAQSKLNNINIHEMFYSMNNFGQEFITKENLEGQYSGNIFFYSVWSDDLKIKTNSIVAESEFVIHNGELNHFSPIMSLSKYISIEELEEIKFSELTNTIYITDERVIIPKMDIHSSAFNISAAGVHKFNNNFNYKIKILLSEVLAAKAKRVKNENEEFGIIEDDGLGKTSLYFNINGTPEETTVSYDRKEMMNTVKQNIQTEKENLKKIFRRKSSSQEKDLPDSPDNESKHFRIVWDEAETDSTGLKKN